jgi:hypothetical protein
LREKIIAGSEVGCVKWRIGFDVEIGLTCGEWIVVGESWAVFMLTRESSRPTSFVVLSPDIPWLRIV